MKAIAAFTLIFLAMAVPPCSVAASGPPAVGQPFPDFQLPVPADTGQLQYLGLTGEAKSFTIGQIQAGVVIIEIFSMYCPHCQREAPTVNDFYRRIEANPKLRGKVKIIGIGAGNSAYEVNFFRKKYTVPFPLFPDAKFVIHKRLGEVRTPYFIAVKIASDGSNSVVFSRLGGAQDAAVLLKELLHQVSLTP